MHTLAIFLSLVFTAYLSNGQSTCPVIQPISTNAMQQQQQQRCKCGIKIDGHIYIYCARKQLKQLPKFTRSSILYDELILSGNSIQAVRANAFQGLKVKRLYLDDNPLRQIEPSAFTELANYLEELYVSIPAAQSSQSVPATMIQNEITTVIKPTRRTHLPTRLFQNLLNLKIIKLNGLDLNEQLSKPINEYFTDEDSSPAFGGSLKPNLFNRTRKLEVIHLVDCGLQKIELNSFSGVEASLRELNLDNNGLSSVADIFGEVFRMRRLKSLNLSRNKINYLASFTFEDTTSFSSSSNMALSELSIDLSFNSMQKIDENAFGLLSPVVSRLNLNNNELSHFQLSFLRQQSAEFKFNQLRELFLDYNKLELIPEAMLQQLPKLELLSLRGNLIQHLSSEFTFYGLSLSLRKLNLAGNRISTINRRVMMHVGKLRELNLERNQLTMNVSFEGLEQELRFLNLEGNSLNAEHLSLIRNLNALETLRIGHNPLKQIENLDLFRSFRNLSYLDMQNSQLTSIPYLTGLNNSLITLNMAQNAICHVNGANVRRAYPKLRHLNLNLNPLKCDCHLASLRQWLDDTAAILASMSTVPTSTSASSNPSNSVAVNNDEQQQYLPINLNWKCAGPNFNTNKYLNRLQPSDLMCFDDLTDGKVCELDEDMTLAKSTITSATTIKTTTTVTTIKSTTGKLLYYYFKFLKIALF